MQRLFPAFALALITSCSAPPEPPVPLAAATQCTSAQPCSAGETCERGRCTRRCQMDAECAPGEVCRAGASTEATVCREPAVAAPDARYIVKLRSTTTEADNCVVPDPGPDIFGATVESPAGVIRGWAEYVWSEVQVDGNNFADASVLDGAPTPILSDRCPDDYDDDVVALGCGADAFVLVRFVNASGDPIALSHERDQVIRVFEWSTQCTLGSMSDTHAAELCADTRAATEGDDSSCTIPAIESGPGERSGEI